MRILYENISYINELGKILNNNFLFYMEKEKSCLESEARIEGLRLESETTWNEVFQTWLEREGAREDWQQVAREKGWQSWEEWRDVMGKKFQCTRAAMVSLYNT